MRRIFAPLVLALRQTGDHHADPTLSELNPTRRYEEGETWGFSIMYVRGLAHLRNHQPNEAATAFRQIVDHRGVSPIALEWSLAHLGLARSYALQASVPAGQGKAVDADIVAKARASYRSFFALWTDADPDIPILQQAKAEYAKLQ